MCLGNILKHFAIVNITKTRLKEYLHFFVVVDYDIINTNDILDIQKNLMKIT